MCSEFSQTLCLQDPPPNQVKRARKRKCNASISWLNIDVEPCLKCGDDGNACFLY